MSKRSTSDRLDNLVLIGVLLGLGVHGCGSMQAEPRSNAGTRAPAAANSAQESCGLVKRAARIWVGFGKGVGVEDFEAAAQASTSILHSLDGMLCGLAKRTGAVAALVADRASLREAAANGGHFEVSSLTLRDEHGLSALVELRSMAGGPESEAADWNAEVTNDGGAWKLVSWSRATTAQ